MIKNTIFSQESRKNVYLPKITKSVKLNNEVVQKRVEELQAENERKELFKMSKFKKVSNKVNTINDKYLKMSIILIKLMILLIFINLFRNTRSSKPK